MTLQIQGAKVLQGCGRGSGVEFTVFRVAPECLSDPNVRQVRRVQAERWFGNACHDRTS